MVETASLSLATRTAIVGGSLLAAVVADQATKHWASTAGLDIKSGSSSTTGSPPGRSLPMLSIAGFGLAALWAIGGAARGPSPLALVGAGLVGGGIASNVWDRSNGHVVDFIKLPSATVNVADVAIGAGLLTFGLAAVRAVGCRGRL